jgi:site-specific DNA-methyltransferase (adenine-specific)
LRGNERIKGKSFHPSQKPTSLMEIIIKCSSDEGDVIWEPFGGLCSASIASLRLKRKSFAAEINEEIYKVACDRIKKEVDYEIMEKSYE